MSLETAPSDATPETRGPSALPVVVLWEVLTLLSVEAALAMLVPPQAGRLGWMLAVGGVYAFVFLLPAFARSALLELTSGLEYAVKVQLMLLHVGVVILTLEALRLNDRGDLWPLACVALGVPLSIPLVSARAFHYLLADLLVLWWGVTALRPDISPVLPLAAFYLMVVGCGAVHLHFRHMRFRRSGLTLTPVWLAALILFAVAVPTALGLRGLIPAPVFHAPPPAAPEAPVLYHPPVEIDSGELLQLIFESVLVIVAGIAVILIAGRILKIMRQRHPPIPFEWPDDTVVAEEWHYEEPRRRRRRGHGGDARERIIVAYHEAADHLRALGWSFPPPMTAREFLGVAEGHEFAARSALADLTGLFERAKYSEDDLHRADLRAARKASRAVGRA
jgi:hypothetical protein